MMDKIDIMSIKNNIHYSIKTTTKYIIMEKNRYIREFVNYYKALTTNDIKSTRSNLHGFYEIENCSRIRTSLQLKLYFLPNIRYYPEAKIFNIYKIGVGSKNFTLDELKKFIIELYKNTIPFMLGYKRDPNRFGKQTKKLSRHAADILYQEQEIDTVIHLNKTTCTI